MGFVWFLLSVVLVVVASLFGDVGGIPATWILVLGTAVWAAYDSTQIHVREYKTTMAAHPLVLGIVIAILWIVFFPWYLTVRQRIKKGTQPRKAGSIAASAPPATSPAALATGELERLADLRSRGVLTEEEFTSAKRRVLGAP